MIQRDQQKSVQAVQAVEDRVAELESILRREGIGPHGEKRKQRVDEDEHVQSPSTIVAPAEKRWRPSPASTDSRSDVSSPIPKRMAVTTVVEILRDLSVEASGGYIGASSQTTMGRMISSIVQARGNTSNGLAEKGWENLSPKSANTVTETATAGLELSQIPHEIAEKVSCRDPFPRCFLLTPDLKLLHGYIRHISTRWPVIQTPFVCLLHTERRTLSDAFL